MTVWRWLLYGLATWVVFAGVWDHSWRLILAAASVWLIYPLLTLDPDGGLSPEELWDDEDAA